ncbi:acyl carrier protein [candidate division KSB1 bacterium]|nr:acyl carrier protein [candidate division KSB1 bacterium]
MANIEPMKEFIIDNFLFGDPAGFSEDTSFLKAGLIDSLGIMELIAFLETTYHIHINDHELVPDNLDSLSKIETFVERKSIHLIDKNQPK